MNKIIKLIYIVCIFIVLCIPVGAMKFYKAENTENRELAELPSLSDWDFGEKFDSYVSDNFAFRNILVNADSKIKADIFNMSGNESVTVGKNGWLFFTETLDDVMSENTMTDREIFCTTRTLEMISDYVKINNGKFVFTIAPNKASVYDEFLPYYYTKSNVANNMDKVVNNLENVDYMDIKSLFENQNEVVYHRLDSHWNNKGALLVTNELLKHLGIEQNNFSEPVLKQDWEGDLYKMLFPTGEEKDDQYYYKDDEFHYTYTRRFKSVDDMTIATENKLSQNGNILLFRDSFGRSMLPFVGESFSKAVLSRSVPYDIDQIRQTDYNYVVLEIVERNIENIIARAPYMKAEKADIDLNSLTKLSNDHYELVSERDSLDHIYGKILADISTDTRIFVSVGNDIFEAFPCYELEENEDPDGKGNGFSLYTDKQSDEINIYISK